MAGWAHGTGGAQEMSETAFCPGASCQKVQPVLIGEDGGRRCGYCKKVLSAGAPLILVSSGSAQAEMVPSDPRLVERIAVLEEQVGDARASLGEAWKEINGLEDRVRGLVAVVASLKQGAAPKPSPPRGTVGRAYKKKVRR